LRTLSGSVDWTAVRELFPLAPGWTYLSSFLFVSHPKPVAEAIDAFKRKIDADPVWLEIAVLTDAEGWPYRKVKQSLAGYIGGAPEELCMTSNTTSALAIAYHGLRIRRNQEILTTEHDHYSHHESIRYSTERSGAAVRYVSLYDTPASATAEQMVDRIARAIRPNTRAVGITWVHSSTGVKTPIREIADVVARANRVARGPIAACSSSTAFTGSPIRTWTSRRRGVTSSPRVLTSGCLRRGAQAFSGAGVTRGRSCGRPFRASTPMT
jgi:isopenicillin-N epimerase